MVLECSGGERLPRGAEGTVARQMAAGFAELL